MEKSLSKDLKESLKRHIELLGYDPKKGKSSLTEVRRHTYLEEDDYTDYADDENKSDEGEDNADFDFGADEGGKEGGDAEGGDNVDFDFGGGDAEGGDNADFDFGGGEEGGDSEEVDEFGTADEFSAADELETSDDDVEEIDVTDIVKRADDAKGYAEKAVTAAEEGKNMIKDLMGKFEALQQSLGAIETVKDEVTSIKKDIQAQKPKEKLELRSLDSYPFNVKLTDYWNDQNLKDNYEIVAGAQSPDGQVQAYKLEPSDATNYNHGDIKSSFIPESKSKKKILTEQELLTEGQILDKIKSIIKSVGGSVETFKKIFNTLKANKVTDLNKAIDVVKSNLGYNINKDYTLDVYNKLNEKLGLSLTESREEWAKSWYVRILTLAMAIMIGVEISRNMKTETLTIKVVDKTVTHTENDSKYLIFTNNEVFEEDDELFRGKFNSSDMYGQLKVGGTYRVKVLGFRIPFLSMYRNIIEVEPVSDFNTTDIKSSFIPESELMDGVKRTHTFTTRNLNKESRSKKRRI